MKQQAFVLCSFLVSQIAAAHRIDEYLQATILSLSSDHVEESIRLIPGVQAASRVISDIDTNGDGVFSDDEKRSYTLRVMTRVSLTVNEQAVPLQAVSWSIPAPEEMRAGIGEIHIDCAAALPPLGADHHLVLANQPRGGDSVYLVNVLVPQNRSIEILAQKRSADQAVYQLDYRQMAASASTSLSPASMPGGTNAFQWSSLFRLGMRHIAEGTDHLLFLFTLLLPATLSVSGARWGPPAAMRDSLSRMFRLVTAFTIGHSLTLGLAAFGILKIPSRPIEVAIAMSILISALHAWRPFGAANEVSIASFFGLVHGLAFAATLEQLGLSQWQRVIGVLSFNLGIEAMQLLAVVAILPSLLLLSRTRAYRWFRLGGAVVAGMASLGWIADRLLNVETAVDSILDRIASHAIGIAAGLLALAVVCRLMPTRGASHSTI